MALPFVDTFTQSTGSNQAISTYNAGWVVDTGGFEVVDATDDVIATTSATENVAYWDTDAPNADQAVDFTISAVTTGIYPGVVARRASAGNYYTLYVDSGNYYVSRYDSSSEVVLRSGTATTTAAGDVFRIEVSGTGATVTIKVFRADSATPTNFVQLGADISDTAANRKTAAGRAGLISYSNNSASRITAFKVENLGAAATADQEGFRFGVDDGSESAHTWVDAQDTNVSRTLGTATLIRALVNGTGDLASAAYTLRYQKNGTGGYAAVPVGASSKTTPVIEAADCTVSGSNTAGTSWAVANPAAATGDLLIFYIAWDDSTDTTDVTEPAGPNSETLLEINATPVTDASTETRAKAWYCVATGAWTAGTITFTPAASESWSATCIKVPAGEFDSTTPIGASATSAATGTAETNVNSPAFSAGATDGSGKLVWCAGVDTDPLVTLAGGWTSLQTQDLGAVAHGVAVRNTAVTDSESITSATWSIAGDSWTSIAFIVRAPTVTNQIYVDASANIAAGGEATTARLTAPSGKTTADFVTGRRWDDENGSDSIDITTDDYTEVEWRINTQSPAANSDYFDLRVYSGTDALASYTVTPRLTIGSAGGADPDPLAVVMAPLLPPGWPKT